MPDSAKSLNALRPARPTRRKHDRPDPLLMLSPDADAVSQVELLRASLIELQQTLSRERDVSVAVGILMVQHRLGRQDAFEQLRQSARRARRKLSLLATEVVQAAEALALVKR